MNSETTVYRAIVKLLDSVGVTENGDTATLKVFIDGGRWDMYIEAESGHRVCIAEDKVLYCDGEWHNGTRTEII